MRDYERLGDILIRKGVLKSAQLSDALKIQRQTGRLLGQIAVDLGYATDDAIAEALASQFWCPLVDLDAVTPEPEALQLIPAEFALSHLILPLKVNDKEIHCVISDPLDTGATDWIQSEVKRRVVLAFAARSKLLRSLHAAYALGGRRKRIVNECSRTQLARPPKKESQMDRQALLDSLTADQQPKVAERQGAIR